MEYYSVLKRNELSNHEMTREKLKHALLCERSQSEKAAYGMIPTIWHSGKGKTTRTVKNQWVPGVTGEGELNKQSPGGLRGREATLYDAVWWMHVLTHLTKPVQCTNIKCGLSVMIMC